MPALTGFNALRIVQNFHEQEISLEIDRKSFRKRIGSRSEEERKSVLIAFTRWSCASNELLSEYCTRLVHGFTAHLCRTKVYFREFMLKESQRWFVTCRLPLRCS